MAINWFDVAVLAFLTWGAVCGYLRGFYSSLLGMTGWLTALITAYYSKSTISYFVREQYDIMPKITAVISGRVSMPLEVGARHHAWNGEDPFNLLQGIPFPPGIRNNILEYFSREGEKLINQGATAADLFYAWIAQLIINLICFLVILLVTAALIKIGEGMVWGKIRKKSLPVMNQGAGFLIGLIQNLLIFMVIISVFIPFLEMFDFILLTDIKNSLMVNLVEKLLLS